MLLIPVCVCSQKRNLKAQILGQKSKHGDKYRKKLEEQEVAYWVASPSLPLRLYGRAGKVRSGMCNTHTTTPTHHPLHPHTPPPLPLQQFMFVLHTEEERETWVSAIKKLQPKGACASEENLGLSSEYFTYNCRYSRAQTTFKILKATMCTCSAL